MASAITSGFSFNPKELEELSQVINELTFADPALNALHDINQGIKYKEQIVFAGRIGLLGKKVTGCTPNAIDGISLTEKIWDPADIDFRLEHCSADVNVQDKLLRQMSRMNPDFYTIFEGSQNVLGQFLVAKVIEGWQENLLRQVWFCDVDADTIANGGVLTNGTDADFFNMFDGLFKQIFAEVSSGDKNYVAITKNAGATYALQALASGDAIATLKAMYNAADSRLLGMTDKKFYVTRTLWDGYLNDLEDIQNQGAGNTLINENGQVTLTYRGVEVVNMEVWDRTIDAYQNNGTVWNLPHRAVLTTPMNIPVGTLAEGDFGQVDAFFDRTLKTNFIDGVYTLDAKHLESYLTVAAY